MSSLTRNLLPLSWWRLGWKWLSQGGSRKSQGKKGLLGNSVRVAIIGHALAVGALSVSFAIVSGFQYTLAQAMAKMYGHISLRTDWKNQKELEEISKLLPIAPQKTEYYWASQALLVGAKGGRGVYVEGRRLSDERPIDGPVRVQVGAPLAEQLGLEVGKEARILLPGVVKGSVPVLVEATTSFGMYDLDSKFLAINDLSLRRFIEDKDPESYAKRPGDAMGIRFFLDSKYADPSKMKVFDDLVTDFKQQLQANGMDPENVTTWHKRRANLFAAIDAQKGMISFVLALLVAVAALNIAATLVVLFLERDREMAILQAVGLSKRQFFQWICLQGGILGLFSSSVGLVLGRVFGWAIQVSPLGKLPADVYFFENLPLKYAALEQAQVFVFGVCSAIAVAALLAIRLSRINLVSVLGDRR